MTSPSEIRSQLHAELDKYAGEVNAMYFDKTFYFNLARAGKLEVALKAIAHFRSLIDEVTARHGADAGTSLNTDVSDESV